MQCPDRTTNLTRGLFSSPPEGFFRTTSPAGGFLFIQETPRVQRTRGFLVEVRRVELLSKTASLRATTCFPFSLNLS